MELRFSSFPRRFWSRSCGFPFPSFLRAVGLRPRLRQQLRREYEAELEQGQKEAEKIYVKLCLSLVRRVSDHGLDVSRLQNGEATAEEAHRTLLEAIELNERRKDQVSGWYEEVRRAGKITGDSCDAVVFGTWFLNSPSCLFLPAAPCTQLALLLIFSSRNLGRSIAGEEDPCKRRKCLMRSCNSDQMWNA